MSTSLANLSSRERRLCQGETARRCPRRPDGTEPVSYRTVAGELTAGIDVWHAGAWRRVVKSTHGRVRVKVNLHRYGTAEFHHGATVAVRS